MILLVVAVIMAIIGFVVGIFISIHVGQRIVQRHIFLLQKKRLAQEFQVKDLQGYDLCEPQAHNQTDLEGPSPALSAEPLRPPTLHPDDERHLKHLGLM